MQYQVNMGAYGESSNVQNSGNYITIIPVEYSRRGYPIQAEYQFNEYRSREEYYSVQSQKLQAEVNAHLYSVSQRLPHLSYSPLGRHQEWDKHDPHKPLPDSKESNSSDSLEKSVMGSNLSSCSNQTASSSIAAGSFSTTEPITSGGSSSSAISPPLPGSSGSTTSSSTGTSNPVTCVYLMSRTAIMVEMSSEEVPSCVTASRFLNAVLCTEELGLSSPSARSLAANVFSLWMCSPLLEIQLKPHNCPWRIWASWQKLLQRYGHGSESRRAKDQPVLRLQRNIFFPKHLEEGIKDSRIQELLYEEARYNVVTGRYPLESAQAMMLGGLQARIQLGPYDPHRHTAKFFREQQDKYLPRHARSGRWARLLPAGRKGSPEARLLEQAQRPPAAPPRKLRHKYLAHTRTLPTYGAAFFQGQIEQPVRSLTSLLTHEDIPVLVAINYQGVYVIDDTESTVLLGLLYEELSWDIGLPSEDNEDCLPCLFLQFMVVENGLRVSKILQVFSKQAVMMDTLVSHFAGEYRKRLGQETPSDHANYDYHSDSGSISLPPLSRPDSPQRRLANKLSRLALATHDGRGNLLGGAGDWGGLHPRQPSWILPKH
ncbi:putative FERM domain-containing protein FRMD8P1 isoform X2 [Aricia agestis]|uniref:putative FERM domain-containing protein FRMD8P1 isoform X2 n=1 Tax=Aricia agestis TaxID=91739 RepID=UPI001C207C74|nr:putative FERM domain-containing protein FRMD8P1 isoform X2 [Aricia agestis]